MRYISKEINQLRKELFRYLLQQEGETDINSIDNFFKTRDTRRISTESCVEDNNTILMFSLLADTKSELGFSIKSFLGADSILFNPGSGTNFIYEVIPPIGRIIDVERFNADTYPINNRIGARIQSLLDKHNCQFRFVGIQSPCLFQNLRTIDGDMPDLLSKLLLARYAKGLSSVKDVTQYITSLNPYEFDTESHGEVYQYKVKRFLQDCAMGMTPEKPWTGFYDATGGQIIVKETGDVVCYHIYEINRFLEYLYNNTKFEGASTSEDENNPGHPRPNAKKKYFYGWLYKENGKYYIKLNLQVRFR